MHRHFATAVGALAAAGALTLGSSTAGLAAGGSDGQRVYKVKVSRTDRVTVTITRDGSRASFTLTCAGGRRLSIVRLPVVNGRFSGVRNEASATRNPVATVRGRVTKRAVTGSYTTTSVKCRRKTAEWRAVRV